MGNEYPYSNEYKNVCFSEEIRSSSSVDTLL